jgi:hypothetical protein
MVEHGFISHTRVLTGEKGWISRGPTGPFIENSAAIFIYKLTVGVRLDELRSNRRYVEKMAEYADEKVAAMSEYDGRIAELDQLLDDSRINKQQGSKKARINRNDQDYNLQHCENCNQMTNHLEGVCQKCKEEGEG